jgi:hypothetical protein
VLSAFGSRGWPGSTRGCGTGGLPAVVLVQPELPHLSSWMPRNHSFRDSSGVLCPPRPRPIWPCCPHGPNCLALGAPGTALACLCPPETDCSDLVAPKAGIALALWPPKQESPWPCRLLAKAGTMTTRAPASASARRPTVALRPSARSSSPRRTPAGDRASVIWRSGTAAAPPQRRFSHGARPQSRPPVPAHRPPEISGNIGRATKNPAENARHAGQSSARLLCTRARSPNFRQVRGRGPGEQPQARPPVGERRSE